MSLAVGLRLGSYEILSILGIGGMGEVYRARDNKLGRTVALKVIHGAFAADPERVARFEREAKVLASITHHHIAALYGMEHAHGQVFLTMELVEGETIADRLLRGPLALEEALRIASQMCEALEAAHEKGIVHRDLKPANIKLTADDQVKVLDFGLAKAVERDAAAEREVANSPTLSMMASSAGLVLGTAAYMSPEQARGVPADHRSDIFSFGITLAEMLMGRPPFQGETTSDVMAAILVRDPDLAHLPQDLSPRLVELLRRCLEKNPKRRWQAIGDVRAELDAIALAPRAVAGTSAALMPRPLWRRAIPIAVTALLAAAAGAAAVRMLSPRVSAPVSRFTMLLDADQQFSGGGRHTVAISPDGLRIAYNAAPGGLFVRPLDSLESRNFVAVPGVTNRVTEPVFSPDGLTVAYWAAQDQTLKRVSLSGGSPVTICRAENPYGISWEGASLIFGQGDGRIMRVAANGGTPETLVQLKGELGHGPHLLPDGEHLLFTRTAASTSSDRWDTATIVVQSLKTGERKTIIERGTDGAYVPTGHVTYVDGGTLYAIRFDAPTATTSGAPIPVVEGVRMAPSASFGAAQYAFSNTGTLVYVSGPVLARIVDAQLAFSNADGEIELVKLPSAAYQSPRVSRDGRQIAYDAEADRHSDIWIYPLSGASSPRRLTLKGNNRAPIWSPDGRRVIYQSDRDGTPGLYIQPADGAAAAQRLTIPEAATAHWPESWSPDGSMILFRVERAGTSVLSTLSLRNGAIAPFGNVQSAVPTNAVFSPDGRWICYTKLRGPTGGTTIYVQPFPATGAEYELGRSRGYSPHHPVWSPDGTRIVFIPTPGGFQSATLTTQPSFAFGNPVALKKSLQVDEPALRRRYDILPDGRLIGLVEPGRQAGTAVAPPMHVVLNWFTELRARVSSR